jgi:hypothetical protein
MLDLGDLVVIIFHDFSLAAVEIEIYIIHCDLFFVNE